jgi:hypothetical protein
MAQFQGTPCPLEPWSNRPHPLAAVAAAGHPGTQLASVVGPGCVDTMCYVSGVLYEDVALAAALSDDPTSGEYDHDGTHP